LKQEGKLKLAALKKDTKRRKTYIFILCFVISASIWLLIKLSNVYDAELLYPVCYKNIPEGKVIVNDVDSFLVIKLKTTGFKLLEYKYFRKPGTLNIDLTRLYKFNTADKNLYFLLTSLLHYRIQQQVGIKNQLVTIKPDTIFFEFENAFSKKVAVKLLADISFKKQFAVYDSISLFPDSVIISGPYDLIKNISYVKTEKKIISNLSSKTEFSTDIINNHPKKISISDKTVKVVIPVEKYTESLIELPVKLLNAQQQAAIKVFPENIKITYLVAMKDFKLIDKEAFTVVADFSKRKNNTIKINLLSSPDKVKVTKIEPETIEYILIK